LCFKNTSQIIIPLSPAGISGSGVLSPNDKAQMLPKIPGLPLKLEK
jgi:hypothetical protein